MLEFSHMKVRRLRRMNIGMLLLIILGGSVGLFSTLYIVVSLIATVGKKIYGKVKYGKSLYA